MHCSLQVLQTPLVLNIDERRLKTELPNWCRIKKRNKQWHANVCECLDLFCLGHIVPALLVLHICVHICVCSFIFHFNYVEDNNSGSANSTQTHTLPPSVFWMVFWISLYEIFVVHNVCFTWQLSIIPLLFPPLLLFPTTRGQQSPF